MVEKFRVNPQNLERILKILFPTPTLGNSPSAFDSCFINNVWWVARVY